MTKVLNLNDQCFVMLPNNFLDCTDESFKFFISETVRNIERKVDIRLANSDGIQRIKQVAEAI